MNKITMAHKEDLIAHVDKMVARGYRIIQIERPMIAGTEWVVVWIKESK